MGCPECPKKGKKWLRQELYREYIGSIYGGAILERGERKGDG